jgi:hypothetical protein
MEEIELFPCYSVPLTDYLTNVKHIKYKLVGLHPETHKKFWVFIRDEKLNNALSEWKITKPIV